VVDLNDYFENAGIRNSVSATLNEVLGFAGAYASIHRVNCRMDRIKARAEQITDGEYFWHCYLHEAERVMHCLVNRKVKGTDTLLNTVRGLIDETFVHL